MLTINVIGKNCNVKIDDILYTVIVNESFDLKKLQNLGLKYYYNLNESKNYFDESGEHNPADKRAAFKASADAYKERIKKMILTQIENYKNVKTAKDFNKQLEKKKLKDEQYKLNQLRKDKVNSFSKFPQLEVKNNEVYLKGLNFILPDDFLKVIQEVENPQPYINFMYNLSSNPNEDVRNKIFTWIHSNGFKITENGYIYAVRWVVKKNDTPELTQFVHSEYTKRKLQKKSPKNYSVYSLEGDDGIQYNTIENSKIATDKFQSTNHTLVGNLYDLFNKEEDLEFTDNYTKTFTIKLGEVVSMNRVDCDETSANCSSGLHALSFNYARDNSFGNQLIGIIVDPKNVVALPYDSYQKFRSCEYYVHNLLTIDDIDELRSSDLVIDDTDFELINVSKIYDSLSDKTNLYNSTNSKERLEEIKSKLQSFKVKPVEPEQLAVVNRLIKL
jgi:hypothetical protein